VAQITQDIPFLAEDTTWENWNGSMLHYFGEEPLPYVAEENWPSFANSMSSLSTFSVYALPGPDSYTDWRDWAEAVILIVNGPTN
jgi:hypothetical protein